MNEEKRLTKCLNCSGPCWVEEIDKDRAEFLAWLYAKGFSAEKNSEMIDAYTKATKFEKEKGITIERIWHLDKDWQKQQKEER